MRERARRSRTSGRRGRWARRALLGVFALVLVTIGGVAVAYTLTDIPAPNDAALSQTSVLYYSDGKTELDRISTVNRESVPLSKVPKKVQQSFLAAEDRDFYENDGVSPKGIGRAVWVGLQGGEQQGGSTITQQYVKNYFLSQDRTLSRKAREILISIKIDDEMSKDQILEDYLNTIYFGRGADGIQTASQAYFGKDVSKLTPAEGALLASVIRAPSLYDPSLGPTQRKNATERVDYVLDGMVEKGWMTEAERDRTRFPAVKQPKVKRGRSDDLGFITQAVRSELSTTLKLSDKEIDRGGLKIVTTIDKPAQDAARQAIKDEMPAGAKDLHVGLVAIQPGDGAVRAMYGGPKFGSGKGARFASTTTHDTMQAGSTFKVFTLLGALDERKPLWTSYPGYSPAYLPQFKSKANPTGAVTNFGGHQYGQLNLTEATAQSCNTCYARLNLDVGPKKTAQMAKESGVRGWNGTKEAPLSTVGTNTFGTDSVKVIDMANAYATIGAEGRRSDPYFIASVDGGESFDYHYEAKPNVRRAYDDAVARDAIQAMNAVTTRGTAAKIAVSGLDRPVAGKTGTTSDNYAAWFAGFTPNQLATAVGIYRGNGQMVDAKGRPILKNQMNNIPGVGEVTGGSVPVDIWTAFMTKALEGRDVAQLPEPGNIQPVQESTSVAPTSQAPAPAPAPAPTQAPAPAPTQAPAPAPTTEAPQPTSTSTSTSSSSTTPPSPTSTTQPTNPAGKPKGKPSPTSSTNAPTTSTTATPQVGARQPEAASLARGLLGVLRWAA